MESSISILLWNQPFYFYTNSKITTLTKTFSGISIAGCICISAWLADPCHANKVFTQIWNILPRTVKFSVKGKLPIFLMQLKFFFHSNKLTTTRGVSIVKIVLYFPFLELLFLLTSTCFRYIEVIFSRKQPFSTLYGNRRLSCMELEGWQNFCMEIEGWAVWKLTGICWCLIIMQIEGEPNIAVYAQLWAKPIRTLLLFFL